MHGPSQESARHDPLRGRRGQHPFRAQARAPWLGHRALPPPRGCRLRPRGPRIPRGARGRHSRTSLRPQDARHARQRLSPPRQGKVARNRHDPSHGLLRGRGSHEGGQGGHLQLHPQALGTRLPQVRARESARHPGHAEGTRRAAQVHGGGAQVGRGDAARPAQAADRKRRGPGIHLKLRTPGRPLLQRRLL